MANRSITFSLGDEYEKEYNILIKLPKRSKYICEAIREYMKTNKPVTNDDLMETIIKLQDELDNLKKNSHK